MRTTAQFETVKRVATEERPARRNGLIEILAAVKDAVGLDGLGVWVNIQQHHYPEAKGREAADTICRLLGETLGIEDVPQHRGIDSPVAGRYGIAELTAGRYNGLNIRVSVYYDVESAGGEGGATDGGHGVNCWA